MTIARHNFLINLAEERAYLRELEKNPQNHCPYLDTKQNLEVVAELRQHIKDLENILTNEEEIEKWWNDIPPSIRELYNNE